VSLDHSPVLVMPSQMSGQLEPLHMNCMGWKTHFTQVAQVPWTTCPIQKMICHHYQKEFQSLLPTLFITCL